MSLSQTEISKLYVSIFGRASEGEGNNFWQNYGNDLSQIADIMLATQDAKDYFGETLNDNRAFIEFIYANTFGKTAKEDPEGIAYWVGRLDANESKGSVINAMVYAATTEENAGEAQDRFNNRVEISNFTADKIYKFNGDYSQFQSYVNGVSSEDYTKVAVQKAIEQDSSKQEIAELPKESDSGVSSLVSGYKWDKKVVTFSFNETIPTEYINSDDYKILTDNWHPFNDKDKEIARESFKKIEEFTDLKFVEVSSGGDIRFNKVDMAPGNNGFSTPPTSENDPIAGDIWISNSYDAEDLGGNEPQSFGYLTILHEIGHSLGLKHPFEGNPVLPEEQNNSEFTIMSYNTTKVFTPEFKQEGYNDYVCEQEYAMPDDYQIYDAEALMAIYGANKETNSGNDSYNLSNLYTEHKYQTIWDAGGDDTIDVSKATHKSIINLADGTHSSIDYHSLEEQKIETQNLLKVDEGTDTDKWLQDIYLDSECSPQIYTGENNLSILKGAIIENVISGSGDDIIFDNSVSNNIITGAGNDNIYLYSGGYDIVDGGAGDDTVYLNEYNRDVKLEKDLYGNTFIYDIADGEIIAELSGVESIKFIDTVTTIG